MTSIGHIAIANSANPMVATGYEAIDMIIASKGSTNKTVTFHGLMLFAPDLSQLITGDV
ncbi:MAG TPA: hypothetical protein VKI44_38420 [Acetobacteraceae bacterium]|nr:hypothetical protein [Acetobacteraceae bacterium]